MADQGPRSLVAQGLQALKAGGKAAKPATAEIDNAARGPALTALLWVGNQSSRRWAQRIQQAISEVGPAEGAGNPILEAQFQVSRQIRQGAPDDLGLDLASSPQGSWHCATGLRPSAPCAPIRLPWA